MPGEQLMSPSTSRLSLYATTFMVGVVVISLGPLLDSITKDLGKTGAQGPLAPIDTNTIGLAVVSSRKNLPVCRGCHAPANGNPTSQLPFKGPFSGAGRIRR